MSPRLPLSVLRSRGHWVFDLDGTLTVAAHDFDAMRATLGLPAGRPILESLARLPENARAPVEARLAELEREVAWHSRIADGALELLDVLQARGTRLAILTRNTRENARITLEAVGLTHCFPIERVFGRDEAPPKPSPAGVLAHLARWSAEPGDAVMVGDFAFDLQAGRAAGAATVYVDPTGRFPHRAWADVCVERLDALLDRTGD